MLMQRKQDVRTGQAVPLTLRFSNGETITTRFRVVGIEDE
jgi:copper(I)-binding protein